MNEYFDKSYGIVYAVLLIPILVAVIFQFIYWCSKDSPGTRGLLPWSFFIAGIAGILIALWVLIYILFMYKRKYVYNQTYHNEEEDEPPASDEKKPEDPDKAKPGYERSSKGMYLFFHFVNPLLFGTAFLLFWWTTRGWVERH